jgi:ketosteroid isomerase-like protein
VSKSPARPSAVARRAKKQVNKKQASKKQTNKKPAKKLVTRAKATTKHSAPSTRQAVRAAAEALQAAIRAGNARAAEKLLAHDFTFIDASGHEHARCEVLDALRASPRSNGTQVKVRDYGRIALITGSYKSAQADERSDLSALDVWIKDAGQWKALIHHNNVLAPPDAPSAHVSGTPRPMDAPPPRCANPLEEVPYQAKSQAERDIIKAFQALELAVTRNDPDEWQTHVADEFVVTRTSQHPTDKAARMAFMATQRAINAETYVAEVVSLKFWVLGDAAVMRADHAMPGNRRPPYRATRLWVKRDGRWQMAISQQTTIQP